MHADAPQPALLPFLGDLALMGYSAALKCRRDDLVDNRAYSMPKTSNQRAYPVASIPTRTFNPPILVPRDGDRTFGLPLAVHSSPLSAFDNVGSHNLSRL
jgi:hypothetical protein